MAAIAAQRGIAIGSSRKQVGISTDDPAAIEHLTTNIRLDKFKKEIKFGPSQSRAADNGESVACAKL